MSVHVCEACDMEFSVIPAISPEKADNWWFCMALECKSYDPSRDADVCFGDMSGLETYNNLFGTNYSEKDCIDGRVVEDK